MSQAHVPLLVGAAAARQAIAEAKVARSPPSSPARSPPVRSPRSSRGRVSPEPVSPVSSQPSSRSSSQSPRLSPLASSSSSLSEVSLEEEAEEDSDLEKNLMNGTTKKRMQRFSRPGWHWGTLAVRTLFLLTSIAVVAITTYIAIVAGSQHTEKIYAAVLAAVSPCPYLLPTIDFQKLTWAKKTECTSHRSRHFCLPALVFQAPRGSLCRYPRPYHHSPRGYRSCLDSVQQLPKQVRWNRLDPGDRHHVCNPQVPMLCRDPNLVANNQSCLQGRKMWFHHTEHGHLLLREPATSQQIQAAHHGSPAVVSIRLDETNAPPHGRGQDQPPPAECCPVVVFARDCPGGD
jgi:hypothetical protein